MEETFKSIYHYQKQQILDENLKAGPKVNTEAKVTEEEESKFNSALSSLLTENNWKIVSSGKGKYHVIFKSSLNFKERINILEILLEDIRERYMDLKVEYQRLKRLCVRQKRKRKLGS